MEFVFGHQGRRINIEHHIDPDRQYEQEGGNKESIHPFRSFGSFIQELVSEYEQRYEGGCCPVCFDTSLQGVDQEESVDPEKTPSQRFFELVSGFFAAGGPKQQPSDERSCQEELSEDVLCRIFKLII